MLWTASVLSMFSVALLAEGVGRNHIMPRRKPGSSGSPSSRRAWVEMTPCQKMTGSCRVALLAEGVGRNQPGTAARYAQIRRPPRGGRG